MAENHEKNQLHIKSSLIKKTIITIMFISIVIGMFAIAIYNKGSYDMVISQYAHYSIDITKLVALKIDSERLINVREAVLEIYNQSEAKVMSDQWGSPEFLAYTARYASVEELEDYKAIHADLQNMQDQLTVDCLFIVWIDTENKCCVYLVDAAHDDPCPPGCIDPVYGGSHEKALKDLSVGLEPNITKTDEYGWLISTAMPIYDDHGEIIAMAAVDISMNVAMKELVNFMFYIGLSFLGVALICCVLSIILISRVIVKPINTLSRAASQYAVNKTAFSELNISRDDEIGILADSMVEMEKDIARYINDLTSTREYAEQMDRAANTDALTDACSKRAYDLKIKQLDEDRQPYGILLTDINNLKKINDTYGHEQGDVSIKTVCRVICRVFDRSSVYRIGGDEFVVILENEEYENREKLIPELAQAFQANEADDSSEPWERVSATIGFAVFDPAKDESVRNVVQRADDAMYKNKKASKKAK